MASFVTAGTVAVTQNSATITGTGSGWNQNGVVQSGDAIQIDGDAALYEIAAVASDTSITITPAWNGSSGSGKAYRIIPVAGRSVQLALETRELTNSVKGNVDQVLAGRFPDGTLANAAVRFIAEASLGFRRKSAGVGSLVAGLQDILEWSLSTVKINKPVTGDAVMANGTNPTAGRLATPGFANLLLNDANARTVLEATGTDSLDALRLSGFFRWTDDTAGHPSGISAGMVLHLVRLAGLGVGRHVQVCYGIDGQELIRHMTDGSGNWSAWREFATFGAAASFAGLTATSLTMGGAVAWSTQVTVADDAVATITPPRKGGWVDIAVDSDGNFPQGNLSARGHMDIGSSLAWLQGSVGTTAAVLTNDQDLSTTPGTDGVMTYALRSTGVVQINNRTGASRTVQFHLRG